MMKASLPEVVSFDIDGTLVDFLAVLHGALRDVGRALENITGRGASFDELQAFRHGVAAEPDYRTARLETIRRESFRRALADYGADPGRHIDALWQVWSGYRATHHHLYEDVLPTLQWLKAAGVRLLAAFNGNTDLTGSAIYPLFDALFYSETLGVSKPDARFDHEVARRIGTDPAAIFHVGD
ncbi:MAG: HAD family hydrolase [Methylococcus sp.]|nr:HAD family hydrolase [Methylococcus sp.]